MDKVLKKFDESLTSLGLRKYIDTAERIIVAFSGGADSCLLLHLTCKYFTPLGKKVECAHLNHMIRGDEADRDEHFCKQTAESLGIKFHLKRVDIPLLANDGGSVEDIARRERYSFFSELASCDSKSIVFTAHNANDNLETVLFNLVRGTSLKGLCGIPPIRDNMYFRPLLAFSSSEIRDTCERLNIEYVTDSTNLQSDYTRNYIRNNIVKSLREISPTPEVAVMRMSSTLRQDSEYLESLADEYVKTNCKDEIFNSVAVTLNDSLLTRVILKKFAEVAGNTYSSPRLEKVHVDVIVNRMRETPDGRFSFTLPGGIVFFSENGKSRFILPQDTFTSVNKEAVELVPDVPVEKNGYIVLLTKDISRFFLKKEENIYNLSIYKALKFDKIKGKLKIRVREPGDVFRFGGMSHKVKKIFSEKKLTSGERETLPIFFDENGIVWIPGFPIRDGLAQGDGDDFYLCCLKHN